MQAQGQIAADLSGHCGIRTGPDSTDLCFQLVLAETLSESNFLTVPGPSFLPTFRPPEASKTGAFTARRFRIPPSPWFVGLLANVTVQLSSRV
jgi:hypothetical protein